jgi:Ca2+-binding RTX toxin-like protein
MATVTVLGAHAQTITLGYDSSSNALIAQQLATLLNAGVQSGAIVPASSADGSPPPVPAGKSGEFVQQSSGLAVLPHGYKAFVTNAANALVFGSGDPNETILSGDTTDLTFFASAGSGTVAAGGGTNRLTIGATDTGAWALYTGNGNDIIQALGRGNDTIGAGAGHNAIQLGAGSNLVVSTGDDTIVAASGVDTTGSGHGQGSGHDHHGHGRHDHDGGGRHDHDGRDRDWRDDRHSSVGGGTSTGADTIDAIGAKSSVVYGNGSDLLFVGGAGGATIFGGSGSDTYYGGNGGSQEIHGGSGGNNYLFAGSGPATLFGGGNGDQLLAYGSAGQTLIGGAGQETLSAAFSSGRDLLIAGSGNQSLVGGTGADTFVGGAGHDTVFAANPGQSLFEFIKGQAGGTELVQNAYSAADIHIHLSGYGANEANHAVATQTTHGGAVTISLSDGTKVTFENITHLSSSNFS